MENKFIEYFITFDVTVIFKAYSQSSKTAYW